jgi:hypothetical protein
MKISFQAIKAFIPEAAILLYPVRDIPQRCGIKLAGTPLCLPPLHNQAGTLQHRWNRVAFLAVEPDV